MASQSPVYHREYVLFSLGEKTDREEADGAAQVGRSLPQTSNEL